MSNFSSIEQESNYVGLAEEIGGSLYYLLKTRLNHFQSINELRMLIQPFFSEKIDIEYFSDYYSYVIFNYYLDNKITVCSVRKFMENIEKDKDYYRRSVEKREKSFVEVWINYSKGNIFFNFGLGRHEPRS